MRILNLCVVVLLVLAASYVYEIKFESTLRAERVAKMRGDVRRERDAIAALRVQKDLARRLNVALGMPLCSKDDLAKRRAAEARLATLRETKAT